MQKTNYAFAKELEIKNYKKIIYRKDQLLKIQGKSYILPENKRYCNFDQCYFYHILICAFKKK